VPRRLAVAILIVIATSACTGGGGNPSPGPSRPGPSRSAPPATSPVPDPIRLDVVAAVNGPAGAADRPYVDGIRMGADEVNAGGGVDGRPLALEMHDDEGSPGKATRLIGELLENPSPALLYVGEGPALSPLRADFQRRQKTVFLLEGDLYTARGQFRQLFQTTAPWEWQAHAIARYLVRDRRALSIGYLGSGTEAPAAEEALRRGLDYWGGRLAWGFTYGSGEDPPPQVLTRASKADAVVVFGPPVDSGRLARALAETPSPPRIVGGASLLVSGTELPPGTAACYVYSWAGWAEPIRRIHLFRGRFRAAFGRDPSGLEQEGYDAVRLLAQALAGTGGAGGRRLINALEELKDWVFSNFHIELGPDDHVVLPRDELGLFAVAGPEERLDPWQDPGTQPWRALMRTFTYDGERTSVLDMDRRVFFPFWRKNQPGPKFFRSRYGIRSRAAKDPLH
jgi:branched-chain amino acid transport system substrate-binding protein